MTKLNWKIKELKIKKGGRDKVKRQKAGEWNRMKDLVEQGTHEAKLRHFTDWPSKSSTYSSLNSYSPCNSFVQSIAISLQICWWKWGQWQIFLVQIALEIFKTGNKHNTLFSKASESNHTILLTVVRLLLKVIWFWIFLN